MRLVDKSAALIVLALIGASPARAETLGEAMRAAYDSNPALLEQRASLRALDERYVQARAGYGPTASANLVGEYQDARVPQGNPLGGPPITSRNIARTSTQSLSLIQPLFTSGQTASRVSQAEANVLAGREGLRIAEAQLLQNVISAYVGVWRDRQLLAIALQQVDAINKELGAVKARLAVRAITRTDLNQTQARLLAAQSQLSQARSRLDVSNSQYLQATGHNPADLASPTDLPNRPATLDQALDIAEADNPTLRQSQYAELSSRRAIDEAKSGFGPQVGLRLDLSTNPYVPYATPRERSVTAEAVVSQPLFSSGLNASRVREALDRNNHDRLDIDVQRRTVTQAVAQQWSQFTTLQSSLALTAEQVAQEEATYRGNVVEETIGLRSTVEVLNALQELQQSRSQLAAVEHDRYLASTLLEETMGLLEIRYFDTGAEPYRPERAFKAVAGSGTPVWERPSELIDNLGRLHGAPLTESHDVSARPVASAPLPGETMTTAGGESASPK